MVSLQAERGHVIQKRPHSLTHLLTHSLTNMANQDILIYGLTLGSAGCAALSVYPALSSVVTGAKDRMDQYQEVKAAKAAKTLDDLFMVVNPRALQIAYGVLPLGLGLAGFLLTNQLFIALGGVAVGALLPDLWVRITKSMRRNRFRRQLIDALLILSSSLRAGLSLMQAFEQLESEMPPPASQEFGLMLKAQRLGRPFPEALKALNYRVPCEELELFTTAVLVARETGGDLTKVIGHLVSTIRERHKLQDKVQTLTLQGRVQAYVISGLPLAFATFVRQFNPDFFKIFLTDPVGQTLIVAAVGLWLVGMFLLFKLSKVKM